MENCVFPRTGGITDHIKSGCFIAANSLCSKELTHFLLFRYEGENLTFLVSINLRYFARKYILVDKLLISAHKRHGRVFDD
jgi:hypothetical protein